MQTIKPLVFFFSSFVIIDVANLLLARQLNAFGILPRSFEHLGGVLVSPWLHGNLMHLIANFTALVVLGGLTWQWGRRVFWNTTLLVILGSGLLVWLLGRPALHIGASGLVYGYFGFCLIGGWLSRRFLLILASTLVAASYGTMLFGVLPISNGVSFESHLFGLIMGLLAAKQWARQGKS